MNRSRRIVAALALVVAGVLGTVVAQSAVTTAAAASAFPNGKNPVVLVHGFSGSGANWNTLKESLIATGYTSEQLTAISYGSYGQSNVDIAAVIGRTVDSVLAETGAAKVDIINHSMGGINSRYCIKFDACAGKVDHWISLAGANRGTYTANLCSFFTPVCKEMVPGSALLKKLNAAPALPDGTKWSTLWSPNDGIIIPAENTVLAGANNIQITGSHLGMLKDAAVAAKVRELLDS
ncbi:esterase/lipase family protein [Actinokineospora iranica]|uniref:Triacylglycerol lipase n=1 Tax=Actinokineospora iranica TaxID=1271860 RepID=A0A1G6T1B3_9PSEU|nr:triacylglycerol lipase [Actinokineospora iranica]SDD22654.1 triacylglycerol lipase [Actinokineospora iranica]